MLSANTAQLPHLPLPTTGLAGNVSFTFYWAHHYPAPPGWTIPDPRRRPYATLWLLVEGTLRVDDGAQCRDCEPGSLVAFAPEAERLADNLGDTPAVLYTAAFDLRVWGELDFFRLYHTPTFHQVERLEHLAAPFAALVAELAMHREAMTLEAEGWARVLVGRWLGALEAAGELRRREGVDERMANVLAAIEADLAGEWSLQRLAELMRLSKVRLREVFVQAVGLPPMRYLTLRRLAHARSLLRESELPCAQIAQRCGFEDPAYFSRMFHRAAGMAPLVYREQSRFERE